MIEKLIQILKEKGCEMGYSGSTWYSVAEIEKLGKQIESESAYEPKCLKCGGIIEYDDCYDIECDGDWVERFYCGHCVECETDHLWSELYEFKGIEKLRIERDVDKNE